MSTDVYARLPPLTDFRDVTNAQHYTDVPADWSVVIADVEGSAVAVEAGRYHAVNFVGAVAIAALLNAAGEVDLPFVFRGDGATLLVPETLVPAAEAVLRSVQTTALGEFGLRLRVGLVPVADVYAAGKTLRIARYQASPHYAQAVFLGDGLAYAARLVKDSEQDARYRLNPYGPHPKVNFSGIECRWEELKSPCGETVTLLVTAHAPGASNVYRDVLGLVERVYGAGAMHPPVRPNDLDLSVRFRYLGAMEPRVRARSSWWRRAGYTFKMWGGSWLRRLFLHVGVTTGTTRRRDYLSHIIATTDHKKLDEMLRMVIAGTSEQRAALEAALEARFRAGTLAYGLHVSGGSVMTCLVYERMGRQVHFVDGAGGGHTRAAKALKARLATLDAKPQPGMPAAGRLPRSSGLALSKVDSRAA